MAEGDKGAGPERVRKMARAPRLGALVAVGLLLIALALTVSHTNAQENPPPAGQDAQPYVLVRADEVTYNDKTGDVTAQGDVEISHNDQVLRADKIIYNEKKDTVVAIGNVVYLLPNGDVVFSDRSEFSDGMKEGIARRFRMLLLDNSRLTAAVATRTGGRITSLNKALFSPCNLCKENPESPPLWRLRSARTTHDEVEKQIEHRDVFLEMWGVPVFYTPYLSHPDPTVKRRSGFLGPSYASDSDFGFMIDIPYYWVIDDSSDLTMTPRFMTDDAAMLHGVYRKRFENARMNIDASVTDPDRRDEDGNKIDGSDTRGHIFFNGELEHDNIWRSRLQIQNASDDTYLRRYKFPVDEQQTLTTKLNTEGFFGRNYAQLSAYSFQGLREEDDPAESPLVLPYAEYHMVSRPSANGAYITADASALAVTRDIGTDSRRLALKTGWHLPYTADTGEIYTLSATLRTDLYSANDVVTDSGATEDGMTGRIFPQLMAKWQYPFVRVDENVTHVVEPIAAVVLAPNGGNPDGIPNEDSPDPELDSTSLFDGNRFTGTDRVESGHRAIYGINWNFYHNESGGVVELFAGQSQRLKAQSDFSASSGLRDKTSDIVARARVAPAEWLDLLYRTRFDTDEGTARRNELSFTAGPSRFQVWANYLFLDERSATADFPDREELSIGFNARLATNWTLAGWVQENLADNGGTIAERLALTYADECFTFRVTATRNFTQDRDLRPTDTLLFQLIFKHLGEFSGSG